MKGRFDNVAREVDTERFNLVKTMEERWKLKITSFLKIISQYFFVLV